MFIFLRQRPKTVDGQNLWIGWPKTVGGMNMKEIVATAMRVYFIHLNPLEDRRVLKAKLVKKMTESPVECKTCINCSPETHLFTPAQYQVFSDSHYEYYDIMSHRLREGIYYS